MTLDSLAQDIKNQLALDSYEVEDEDESFVCIRFYKNVDMTDGQLDSLAEEVYNLASELCNDSFQTDYDVYSDGSQADEYINYRVVNAEGDYHGNNSVQVALFLEQRQL